MSKEVVLFHIRDYRGATVEDLDIRPAISINPLMGIQDALEIAFENEFTYLPVIHEENKRLLGILNVEDLKKDSSKVSRSFLKPIVKNYMFWFHRIAKERYEKEHDANSTTTSTTTSATTVKTKMLKPRNKKYNVITPLTPLEELAAFFNKGVYFAIITNAEENFVYGVATPEDLIKYENSRPKL